MTVQHTKVRVGGYVLSLSAVPDGEGLWFASFAVATMLNGGVIRGPETLQRTFQTSAEAIAAADSAARRTLYREIRRQ